MSGNPYMFGQARGARGPRAGLAAGLIAALAAWVAPETLQAQGQDEIVTGPVAEYHDLLLPRTTGGGLVPEAEIGAPPPGKDWQPASFSPVTGLFHVPANNYCENTFGLSGSYISGTPYVNAEMVVTPGPGGHRGEMIAWDATTGTKVWSIKEDFAVWAGTLATAGNVVFYGTLDRWFKAVDAETGELLWQFRVPSGIVGQPVTYTDAEGRQYVAVLSGIGGQIARTVTQQVSLEDPTAAAFFAYANRDLPDATNVGGVLMVFALDEEPAAAAAEPAILVTPEVEVEPELEVEPEIEVEPAPGDGIELEVEPEATLEPEVEVEPEVEPAIAIEPETEAGVPGGTGTEQPADENAVESE